MPVYDFKCATHGLFNELKTMDSAGQPCACPHCGVLSPRVILVAPEYLDMKKENRLAHKRNEVATHNPIFSTPDFRAEQNAIQKHHRGSKCGCGERPIRQSGLMYTADGNKMFPSARPWMISH